MMYFPFLKGWIFEEVSSQGKFFNFTSSSPIRFKLLLLRPSSINNFIITFERLFNSLNLWLTKSQHFTLLNFKKDAIPSVLTDSGDLSHNLTHRELILKSFLNFSYNNSPFFLVSSWSPSFPSVIIKILKLLHFSFKSDNIFSKIS